MKLVCLVIRNRKYISRSRHIIDLPILKVIPIGTLRKYAPHRDPVNWVTTMNILHVSVYPSQVLDKDITMMDVRRIHELLLNTIVILPYKRRRHNLLEYNSKQLTRCIDSFSGVTKDVPDSSLWLTICSKLSEERVGTLSLTF